MKKKILILLLILSVVCFYSCKRENRTADADQELHSEDFIDSEYEFHHSAAAGTTEQGFCLFVNAGFYIFSGEDAGDETTKVKWSASIALGERLLVGETRRMVLESDSRTYDFIEVRRLSNNTEGFVLAWQVSSGGQLAVVIGDNVNLYRTARIIDVSGVVLARRSVIVFFPETEADGFFQVRGYDIIRRQYVAENNSFIRHDTISIREADIQSAILLQTALALTAERQASQREALLKSALEYYPDSVFYDEIYEVAFPYTPVTENIADTPHDNDS